MSAERTHYLHLRRAHFSVHSGAVMFIWFWCASGDRGCDAHVMRCTHTCGDVWRFHTHTQCMMMIFLRERAPEPTPLFYLFTEPSACAIQLHTNTTRNVNNVCTPEAEVRVLAKCVFQYIVLYLVHTHTHNRGAMSQFGRDSGSRKI